MAILPSRANVRILLGRLRPGSEFGWKGGRDNDTAQVRYRDPTTVEPTEAEYLAELAIQDTEKATAATTRTAMLTRSAPAVGKTVAALTTAELQAVVEEILFRGKALDRNAQILPVNQWRV